MSRKLRILLADDSRFFRAIETQFLQKTPVEILEAESCEEAISVVRREKPDLVFMAFSLPDKGGAECCAEIKRDFALKSVPVVMICDQNEPDQPGIAEQKGCDACLVKPLDRHSFLQIGRQFIDEIREHRQPTLFSVNFSAGGEEYSGKCLDISGGGLFIESSEDIPAGSLVNISFKLPDELGTQFSSSAEVMWLNRRPNPMKPHYPNGLGLKFVALPVTLHKAVLRLSSKKTSS